MVPVTARLEGRDLGSAVAECKRALAQAAAAARLRRRDRRAAALAAARVRARWRWRSPAALALVLLVLVFQFGGFAAPARDPGGGAAGARRRRSAALAATGIALNVSSLLGAILLVGLVVKNGILLLHRAASARAAGRPLDDALPRRRACACGRSS